MALTYHREPNRANWIGVRPGHDGQQIARYAPANNATVIIYTVPADKILLLCSFTYNAHSTGGNYGTMGVYNAAAALQYLFVNAGMPINGNVIFHSGTFNPPLEIPTGYTIRVVSTGATVWASGFIHGVIIPPVAY